jgi:hypothetical protein
VLAAASACRLQLAQSQLFSQAQLDADADATAANAAGKSVDRPCDISLTLSSSLSERVYYLRTHKSVFTSQGRLEYSQSLQHIIWKTGITDRLSDCQ